MRTYDVEQLLLDIPDFGSHIASKLLSIAGIRTNKQLTELTSEQRFVLTKLLKRRIGMQ